VVADSADLKIGQTNVSDDPLFANTSDVVLTGAVTGQPITVVAGKNIITNGATSIDSSPGGNITLIAGASFTGTAATGVTVTKGNTAGGIIDLTGGSGGTGTGITKFSADNGGGTAGNILMVAYGGSAAGTGSVLVPNSVPITANGVTRGNVTIIAGAKS